MRSEPVPSRAHRAAPSPAGTRQPDTTAENRHNTTSNKPRLHPESSRLGWGAYPPGGQDMTTRGLAIRRNSRPPILSPRSVFPRVL